MPVLYFAQRDLRCRKGEVRVENFTTIYSKSLKRYCPERGRCQIRISSDHKTILNKKPHSGKELTDF